ncbi:LuxR family transcriptional regulator [Mucilaginibacter terrenus]|uniref:LuxR family transcriptional regulator n=1 Tax=Mucilaginibacter terrenus TaxID=2482727 RepID=A0A3E2NUC9_9SPHI|nr:AAA family ATPase [Mucilaginibacter terrenus]RFZ84531.1 LuxR family transcriptional regulator [Mucilaginibacter terrenus]
MTYYPSYHTAERPMEIELIRSMIRGDITSDEAFELKRKHDEDKEINTDDAFISKTATEWLNVPKEELSFNRLFGTFWSMGELCILFADTNVGKSILAVQIGNSITRGEMIGGLSCTKQTDPVLYFDFELSAAQFALRYSNRGYNTYEFAPHFHRLVINPDAGRERKFASFHDYIINAFENVLVTTKARTMIIDNITCLRTSTESGAGAIKLMQSLQRIKQKYNLSILVLAHTPKRNPARPITRNDLQGSKMLLNFADSAFAMGESHTSPGMRYLKQIKARNDEVEFGADSVMLCRIVKPYSFLKFEMITREPEAAHLLTHTEQMRKTNEDTISKLHAEGRSVRQIAAEVGQSRQTVFRVLKKLERTEESAGSPIGDPP